MGYYVTTPIYYVNSDPHLGHAYTTIIADVVTRYRRLIGERAFMLTGSDEHGTKIVEAADKAGVEVKQFVDTNSQRFRDLLPLLDAEADFFIRTTDEGHQRFVQEVLGRLHEQGDIYEGTYSGLYCTACEDYYTEAELLDGELCPVHKRPATTMEETNWFFKLSAYQERLKEHFLAHPEFVRPKSRYNEALSMIEGGLHDLSISRSSITWGVDVPWDPTQVFYVWIDALFNYRSALEYAPGAGGGALVDEMWPPSMQLLAKDILKFHAVIWPALLMAAGYELPKQLFIHGYLLQGGDKMSKTTGNVFDPFPVVAQHGADPLRFYLLREVPFGQDGSVSQETFNARYTSELANDLGNLVSRTAAMLDKYLADDAGISHVPTLDGDSDIAANAATMVAAWRAQMDELDLTNALETVWTFVRSLNRLVEERAPWTLAKTVAAGGDDADVTGAVALLHSTLAELVEGLVCVAYTLLPVMPQTAVRIAGAFGVDAAALNDWKWGVAAGGAVTKPAPLFPRLEQPAAN